MPDPETWLLGRVKGVSDLLMPVGHALLQARRELNALRDETSTRECRLCLGGAATVGFHIAHIAGSLDRLFTYARGDALSPVQVEYLLREEALGLEQSRDDLFATAIDRIDLCLDAVKDIPDHLLLESRVVGRDQLPSTVIGLLFHAAEHTTMHVGQIRTTLKVSRGLLLVSRDLICKEDSEAMGAD